MSSIGRTLRKRTIFISRWSISTFKGTKSNLLDFYYSFTKISMENNKSGYPATGNMRKNSQ